MFRASISLALAGSPAVRATFWSNSLKLLVRVRKVQMVTLGNGKGGSVVGTMIGVMTMTLISTSLIMLGVPSYAQTFVIGVLLLMSVALAAAKNAVKE